jgi:hypothetical protein
MLRVRRSCAFYVIFNSVTGSEQLVSLAQVCMNLVGNFGVQQGVSGDLLIGLPTQMTEMHSPARALFLIDAPVGRVKAVLARRADLRVIVHNSWVRFFVRDPTTGVIYRQTQGEYEPAEVSALNSEAHVERSDVTNTSADLALRGDLSPDCVSFRQHQLFARSIASQELMAAAFAFIAIGLSAGFAIYTIRTRTEQDHDVSSAATRESRAFAIVVCATWLAFMIMAFAQRYLHGEDVFIRVQLLSAALLVGFNLVASSPLYEQAADAPLVRVHAPQLAHSVVIGWATMGFASALLIGSYNDRATVQSNATFVFAVYEASDFLLLVALALAGFEGGLAGGNNSQVAAIAMVTAALIKTSQFPFCDLFARAMEGASPSSALGYGALSAHSGLILLALKEPLWFPFRSARVYLGVVGALTALISGLIAKLRADRKGGIGYATSGTVGLLYVLLAIGGVATDVALFLGFAHAVLRTQQILRAHNGILEVYVTICLNCLCATYRAPSPTARYMRRRKCR